MKYILALILLFYTVSCSSPRNDELCIFDTVCIDGYMCVSNTDGMECRYIPIKDRFNNFVRCQE